MHRWEDFSEIRNYNYLDFQVSLSSYLITCVRSCRPFGFLTIYSAGLISHIRRVRSVVKSRSLGLRHESENQVRYSSRSVIFLIMKILREH